MLSDSWPTIGYENSPSRIYRLPDRCCSRLQLQDWESQRSIHAMVRDAPDLLLIVFFAVLLRTHGMYDSHTRIHSIFFFWVAAWTWTEDDMHIYILVVVDWK
jgi:hypothetical protein